MDGATVWGDVATWVTGIATILLLIAAFVQIRIERASRHAAEKALASQRTREQAEKVACWVETEETEVWIAVQNSSSQPVYELVVRVVPVGHDDQMVPGGDLKCVLVAPPGKGYVGIQSGYAGMSRRPGATISFIDAAGKSWHRKTNGQLVEIDVPPVHYHEVFLPADWYTLVPHIPTHPP